MLSQSTTTVQQSFCSKQIVMVDSGLSSVAISPLNPTDKNSVVNMIFQVSNMCKCVHVNYVSGKLFLPKIFFEKLLETIWHTCTRDSTSISVE